MTRLKTFAWRALVLVAMCALALQLAFALRVGAMAFMDPQSTSFQRSEAWRLWGEPRRTEWHQQWVPYERISPNLKRAVIASEDAGFVDHSGVEWDAIEQAWERNQRAEARAEVQATRARSAKPDRAATPPKVVGGSTISQQLAKNLFLSGERTVLRKAQEFVLTTMIESMLSKQRILEIYLNSVEWGEGVFGAQAAAQHYFSKDAAQLSAEESARLAVMLPAPKRFQKRPGSAYMSQRAATIVARMAAVQLP